MLDRNVSLLVAIDDDGFSLYRVRGPQLWISMGRHHRRKESIRLAAAALTGLNAIPYNLFARAAHGEQFADKKLTVVLKSCDDDFLEQMKRLDEITEDAQAEWRILKHLTSKFDFKLKKVAERSAAMEHLKAFHQYEWPRI